MKKKIYIMVDMEGISGTVKTADVDNNAAEYQRFRRQMTKDVNAAVAGAFDGGATEVLVNDAHDSMTNILFEEIDPRVKLISGRIKPMCMVAGLDDSFDGMIMVGAHAKAGSTGIMAHTMYGVQISALFLNGVEIGEMAMNASAAAGWGVPVIMISGDASAQREAKATVDPEIEFAVVKEDITRWCAALLPPEQAEKVIREAACNAVKNLGTGKKPSVPAKTTYKLRFHSSAEAECACLVPQIKRVDDRTVTLSSADPRAAYQLLIVAMTMGYSAFDRMYG